MPKSELCAMCSLPFGRSRGISSPPLLLRLYNVTCNWMYLYVRLLPHIRGNVGLVFTKGDLSDIRKVIDNNKVMTTLFTDALLLVPELLYCLYSLGLCFQPVYYRLDWIPKDGTLQIAPAGFSAGLLPNQ